MRYGRLLAGCVAWAVMCLVSCGEDAPEHRNCSEQTPCEEGQYCETQGARAVCIPAICGAAKDCCSLSDSSCDLDGATAEECAQVLADSQADGYCLSRPDGTMCNQQGDCTPSTRRYSLGNVCCDGFTCQRQNDDYACLACLDEGDSCSSDGPECCPGYTCRFGEDACTPVSKLGQTCVFDHDCADGLFCAVTTCEALRKAGEPCEASDECAVQLTCDDDGRCAEPAPIGSGGDEPDPGDDDLVCDPNYCSGCMSSCAGDYCFSCCWHCLGNTCVSTC